MWIAESTFWSINVGNIVQPVTTLSCTLLAGIYLHTTQTGRKAVKDVLVEVCVALQSQAKDLEKVFDSNIFASMSVNDTSRILVFDEIRRLSIAMDILKKAVAQTTYSKKLNSAVNRVDFERETLRGAITDPIVQSGPVQASTIADVRAKVGMLMNALIALRIEISRS